MNTPQIGYLALPLDTPKPKNFFERILQVLDGQMTEPTPFGWFHWIFITLTVLVCVFVVYKRRTLTSERIRHLLLATGVVMLALETYKQLNGAYNAEEDVWHYDWGAFPFQFCSTPLYLMPLSALLKQGRFQKRLFAFLGTYCLVAGVIVMVYPTTVFGETIGVNVQTMLHHGAMIVVAVMLLASGNISFDLQSLKDALFVFLPLCATAMVMNGLFIAFGDSETYFNMFYISPTEDPPADFLVALLDRVPYLVYLIGYLTLFTLGAYLVLRVARFLEKKYFKTSTDAEIEPTPNEPLETNA